MGESNAAISSIPGSSKLFFRAEVTGSLLGEDVLVGDMSRVRDSSLGDKVRIDRQNFVLGSHIGRFTYTGPFDMVFHADIGQFCSISYGVTIAPPEHDYHRVTTHPFIYRDSGYGLFDDIGAENNKFSQQSKIGNDVWIGCNATVLRGVTIGDGAVIAANALVNKDVPPYAIVAGVPAKVLKLRFDQGVVDTLLEMRWWDWSEEEMRQNKEFFLSEKPFSNAFFSTVM